MSYENVELESTIQAKCDAILRKLKIPHFHYEKGHGRGGKTHRAGFPDLIWWHNFRSFAVEIKTLKGRMKPEQLEWLEKLKAQGVYTAVVRSEEDFIEFLRMNSDIIK